MDVVAPTDRGQPATSAAGTYSATSLLFYTWPGVKPGTHTFFAQLVNNDNTPLATPVTAKVVIVVTASTGTGP
jgi:hypothetical protein